MPKPKAKTDKAEKGKVTSKEPEQVAEPAAEDLDSATAEDEELEDLKARQKSLHLLSSPGQSPCCKLAYHRMLS